MRWPRLSYVTCEWLWTTLTCCAFLAGGQFLGICSLGELVGWLLHFVSIAYEGRVAEGHTLRAIGVLQIVRLDGRNSSYGELY